MPMQGDWPSPAGAAWPPVSRGHAFGYGDQGGHAGIGGLENRVGGEGGRHIDDARVGARRAHRLFDGVEHRQAEMLGAAFARGHAPHHAGAIGDGLLRVEGALGAGGALANDAGAMVDEDGHGYGLTSYR